jgi:hypothetical protein
MGVCGVRDSCCNSTTSGNETCDTAAGRPQWFLLRTRSKQERKVADAFQAKGYGVFLPMHTVRQQWSDRLKTYDAPLFPGYLFCRFSLTQEKLQNGNVAWHFHDLACLGKCTTLNRIPRGRNTPQALYLLGPGWAVAFRYPDKLGLRQAS